VTMSFSGCLVMAVALQIADVVLAQTSTGPGLEVAAEPTGTPMPTDMPSPDAGEGWKCGPSICCQTNPPWLSGWFLQNMPNGDICQLELQAWGYVLVAGAAFLLSSILFLVCYATRQRRCWDPCRLCCIPCCNPDFQVTWLCPYASCQYLSFEFSCPAAASLAVWSWPLKSAANEETLVFLSDSSAAAMSHALCIRPWNHLPFRGCFTEVHAALISGRCTQRGHDGTTFRLSICSARISPIAGGISLGQYMSIDACGIHAGRKSG